MPHLTLSREQVRSIDQQAIERLGIPGIVLMENAGRGCTDFLLEKMTEQSGRVVICCGKGNNGGDGFVIARQLMIAEVPVEIVVFHSEDDFQGDARTNLTILKRMGCPVPYLSLPEDEAELKRKLSSAGWLVDALLGTGATGAPRAPYDTVISAMNASGVPILAVDVPSGLDCDSGEASATTIRARLTATFASSKPGLELEPAQEFTGEVRVIPIGLPESVLTSLLK
ncbi:MAG: NAD(P)H-hydrate epimerase [Planctomycetaceae bacterium]|nr:NAD(P)H-hydrate epimerase [Planctomycetaceae bacterium]